MTLEQSQFLITILTERFPELMTGEDLNGADAVDRLASLLNEATFECVDRLNEVQQ